MPTSSACSQLQFDLALEGEGMAVRRDEAVDLRKRRRLAFAEISPEDAALLDHGIGALLDALAQVRALRLRRRLQALAGDVEQPAMERAAQAAMFEPAEGEVGAAMRAVAVDQAVAAVLVAKQHEIFAEQLAPAGPAASPCSSSTSAAGCQYIRINLPQGSLRPVRVIRSFCSGSSWRGSPARFGSEQMFAY